MLLLEEGCWPGSPFLALDARSASCRARLSAFSSALLLVGLSEEEEEAAAGASGAGAVGPAAVAGEGVSEGTVTGTVR